MRKIQFDRNISTIKSGLAVYSYIEKYAKNMEVSILLRALYSMLIGAFDTYLHGVLEDHLVASIFNTNKTNSSTNDNNSVNGNSNNDAPDFDIGLSVLKDALKAQDAFTREDMLRKHVRERLSKVSFQAPTNVESVMKYLGIKHIWREVGKAMGKTAKDVRNILAICVRRRNKISHESDWNQVTMKYEEISLSDVTDCSNFLVAVVETIDKLIHDCE